MAAASLAAQTRAPLQLADVTRDAGITFVHQNGATGRKYLPETMGSGSAFLDYDGDGDQDLLLVNGVFPALGARLRLRRPAKGLRRVRAALSQRRTGPLHRCRRRARDSRCARHDVAQRRFGAVRGSRQPRAEPDGTHVEYGMGVAAADFDNDGAVDVLLTAVGQSRLFRNIGQGHVRRRHREGRAIGNRRAFSTSAMWLDYDRDGWLDLLICNYVQWTPEGRHLLQRATAKVKAYCTPEAYRGSTSWLYRNAGNGTFEDVTARAGLFDVTSKSLGVTMLDHDQDGWPDIFIANDTQPNKLYRNNRNGTFTELGLKSGLAFSEEGRARAGMGADAADVDNSGRPAVVVTNFSGEMLGLYAPLGDGQYIDRAPRSDVGRATRQTLGWGCFFFDVDLDGLQDLLVVNGHLDATLARAERQVRYAESPHLFLNRGLALRRCGGECRGGVRPAARWGAARRSATSTATAISTSS